jgi:hypothetical protein
MEFDLDDGGSLIVCGDYDGDLEAIAEVLNTFEFDAGEDRHERFGVHDGRIRVQGFGLGFASAAFPLRWWWESKDGRRLPNNEYLKRPDEERHRVWNYVDYDYPDLAELSKMIAPWLTRGTFVLVSCQYQIDTIKVLAPVRDSLADDGLR